MVASAADYKYSNHAGIKANELITDYDIGIRQDQYLEYLQSMVKQKYSEVLKTNTKKRFTL